MSKFSFFKGLSKKLGVSSSTALLTAFALFFASAPCIGRLHEPEVPESLQH